MKVIILFLLISVTLSGASYAASNKEEYDLQERCGKRAEEILKPGNDNGISEDDKQLMMTGYRNHYNRKLNKCFVLQTTTTMPKNKKESPSILEELWDINENKLYGRFFKVKIDNKPFECNVLGEICNSENEWDSLVKPYMEE